MATTSEPTRSQTTKQQVFGFGGSFTPPPLNKELLGGKGKGLAEMASINMPVPPGMIITTEACNLYRHSGRTLSPELKESILAAMQQLEQIRGMKFGAERNPLLVSVRSGARVSMPGMMDTILNLGLNDRSVEGFAEAIHNPKAAYDSYRRFLMMYSEIVDGVGHKHFERASSVIRLQEGVHYDIELSINALKDLCQLFKRIHQEQTGQPFPEDPNEQLFNAIAAVFNSWDSERAILYRQINRIPADWGTAVVVQSMVFGNRGENSATGVAFTRNPASGENAFYGEFLSNAQGEDVVAGTRTPHPINTYQKKITKSSLSSLEEIMPEAYQQLLEIVKRLEKQYKDMQDIEFTIEEGKLYMLQTRTGKRTGFASIRMAVEMLEEGLIDEKTALRRIDPNQLAQLLAPIFDPKDKANAKEFFIAKGLNAGPGAASGQIAFTSERAVQFKNKGIHCILVREEASPDDFPGMVAADGILTLRGGSTSHAAVVARGMGKPCVVGCDALIFNEEQKVLNYDQNKVLHEGDSISIDGLTGEVFACDLPTSPSEILQVLLEKTKQPQDSLLFRQFEKVMELADKYRTLRVRTNADTPKDSQVARAFGAEGIGLCRTEHMFMDVRRLNDVRCMFFSTRFSERQQAIDLLLPHQKSDFIGIFKEMDGLPVTIRLLDPPLHEFMPHNEDELNSLAQLMGVSRNKLTEIRSLLEEQNPMLGNRGCRLGITFPELTAMQARAILEAAIEVTQQGYTVIPEIMIPLVGIENEFHHQKAIIEQTAQKVFAEKRLKIPYYVGTMIELPRACLIADKIAQEAEFFSFGTNDLTQTTFGISRDDSSKFVPAYVKGVVNPTSHDELLQILPDDPFQVIDPIGVGELMKIAVQRGRKTRPGLKCGICGEHGGEAHSIAFCHSIGLDYVSCSPYRVPIARLAAALPNVQ